jgi:hypothetical protein
VFFNRALEAQTDAPLNFYTTVSRLTQQVHTKSSSLCIASSAGWKDEATGVSNKEGETTRCSWKKYIIS